MKVLAIDDQPEALKQIEREISAANGPDGKPYQVAALTDHLAAVKRLSDEYFDVVITDLVMGPDEKEGLQVLKELTGKSPITIVLTAYPSIRMCVAAMRAGAWDFLEKVPDDGSDAYENLLASLRKACETRLAHPEAGRSNPDSQWIHDNLGDLMREYPGELVAVLDGQVVDHDRVYKPLAKRLKERFFVAQPEVVAIPDVSEETIG